MDKVQITVYGRKQICASCVGAPGSKDTYEWLQAAIGRKYGIDPIAYTYIDMDETEQEERHRKVIEHIIEEELFYPLVMINDAIIAEGVPHLKTIFRAIESEGIKPIS